MTTVFQPILEDERIRLTAIEDDDMEHILDWHQDTDFLMRLHGEPAQPFYMKPLKEMIESWRSDRNGFAFAIRPHEMDGTIAGIVAVFGISWVHGTGMLGVNLGRENQDKGYGGASIRLLLDFAFREANLHRVELYVFGFNAPGLHLYEKLGFTHEARYREVLFRYGGWHDILLMGMLRHEWETKR